MTVGFIFFLFIFLSFNLLKKKINVNASLDSGFLAIPLKKREKGVLLINNGLNFIFFVL